MAVQKYRKVDGYNVLESFAGTKIPAFSLFINKTFSRTYCSCGKSYAGIKERCDCGNPVTHHFDYNDSASNLKFYCKKEVDRDGVKDGKLIIGYSHISFDSSSGYPSTMKIHASKQDIYVISKDGFEALNRFPFKWNDYGFYKYVSKCFEEWVHFDEYKFWYEKIKAFHSGDYAAENSVNFEYKIPNLYKDPQIYQYPYLTAYYIDESRFKTYKNLSDFFTNRVSIDVAHMDIINYYLYTIYEKRKNGELSYYDRYSNAETLLKDFQKYTDGSYDGSYIEGSINLINHYVYNHLMALDEAVMIFKLLDGIIENPSKPKNFPYDYKYFTGYYHKDKDPFLIDFFRVEYLQYFEIYLKENVSITTNKANLPYAFIERIRQMTDLKIPIKEDNFKIKNFNWLVTSKKMAPSYKLPENKVELFLDMFETSPIDALELISNRRKLTEKQIFALIDKMAKK